MNDNNTPNDMSIEELEKQGYKVAGSFSVNTDGITGIDISSTSFDPDISPQSGRLDSTTRVVAPDGSISKLTPFVTGRKYKMENGRYVSETEFAEALQAAVNSLDEGQIVVSKTGKVLNPDDLFEFARSVADVITIGDKTENKYFSGVERSITTPEGIQKKFPPAFGHGTKVIKKDKYYLVDGLATALEDFVVLEPTVEQEPKDIAPTKPDIKPTKHNEPETVRVVRVDKKWKNKATAWLCAATLAMTLASGLSLQEVQQTEMKKDSIISFEFIEQGKRVVSEEYTVEEIFLKFAADEGYDIGTIIDVAGKKGFTFGDLTGNSITLPRNLQITGFCIYNPDGDYRETFNFYEDRNLDGNSERTSVGEIQQKTTKSLEEFLSKVDISKYDLNDIKFSLHFDNLGWVDFSEIISIREETIEHTKTRFVEICGDIATQKGVSDDVDVDFIKIVNSDGKEAFVPITDENDQLYAPGSKVIGSDGKEYVISQLEIDTIETESTLEEGKKALSWSIEDCELALAIAPLVAAAAFAVSSKIKNEKNKKDPSFFEFENSSDYQQFMKDFEKAREDYRKKSKFGQTLKRVFYGEQIDYASNLTEEQIQDMYTAIKETHNGNYDYHPDDKIRFIDGQIYAFKKDGSRLNITDTVTHIGQDNKPEKEGLLTDDVIEKHGGGSKK